MTQPIVLDGRNIYDKKKWKNKDSYTVVLGNEKIIA